MKKTLLLILFSCCFGLIYPQTPSKIKKEDIIGRWIEIKDTNSSVNNIDIKHPYTYIFRDNMIFHLGEAFEGVILFNTTGRYSIEGDSINVVYYDLILGNTKSRQARHILFKIQSLNKDEMILLAQDYDYERKIILKKINLTK